MTAMNRRTLLQTTMATAFVSAFGTPTAIAQAVRQLSEAETDVEAVGLDGAAKTVERAAIKELRDALRGQLLLPGADGYDTARKVFNPDIDRFPALIVRPTGVADIQLAVTFAAERDLLLAVKCGGHSFSGNSTCNGGLQLDLSSFRHVRVDPQRKRAHVAGGSLLGELDHEAMAHGLVTTAGTVSHTGVGGLTLGGGLGRVGRRFGLALDNVKAYNIVTADGQLRRASPNDNPELYWALRGGGGNFGVVTSFEFALHAMQRHVVGGEVMFPISRARELLDFYGEFSTEAPRELYVDFNMMAPPGAPGIAMITICYSGPESQAEATLAPLRKLGKSLRDGIKRYDYVALQRATDDTDPRTGGAYLKSGFVRGVSDRLADDIVRGFGTHPDRGHILFFQHSGGAIGDVGPTETAFAHRDATHDLASVAFWSGGEREPHVQFLKQYWSTLEPHTRGQYVNSSVAEEGDGANAIYLENYKRLVAVKHQYDPGNQFRLNANIRPTA